MTTIAWTVLLPLAGASAALLAGRRLVVSTGLATAALTFATVVRAAQIVWSDGPIRHAVGGWGAPLGIDLVADGLSVTMLLMTAAVGTGVSAYAALALGDSDHQTTARSFWPLWLFLWASLNAVFLSGDLFNLYVSLELLTLAAVGLVVLARGPAPLTAATRYLIAALMASMAYLFGVAILYGTFGALDMAALGDRVQPGLPAGAALALMTAALLMKTAVFPLHFWLPRAHASAITPASAILSALVIKASFYIALRLWATVFTGAVTIPAAQIVGALGAIAVLWGGFQASRQHHLKLLVGYSTVSQIGYLFLMFPLVFPLDPTSTWRDTAWTGGVYQALSHAFAKAAMFLAAGLMIHAAGSERVTGLRGLGTHLPIAVFAFGLAGLSIIGLPPSGGFVGKWLLLGAALDAGQWWWSLVILGGGLLSGGYIFLVLGQALTPADATSELKPVPRGGLLQHACLGLALIGFALGLRATELVDLIGGSVP